jgi:DNA-binding CsgD family transcriptional regulator
MGQQSDINGRALELAEALAGVSTVGVLIDRTLNELARLLESPLVSFTEIDLITRTAAVSFRPYLPGHSVAVDDMNELLDEHPAFIWYCSQPDWSAVRLSDLISWEELSRTRLFGEVLVAVGGQHMMAVPLVPPATGRIICFIANRPDRDFDDDELEFVRRLQPVVVALYRRLSMPATRTSVPVAALTRREQAILKFLAGGLTADAIGRQLSCTSATVRKHLQNVYVKLQTHDRLTTVVRARDLGLIRDEDLSREFEWNIRLNLPE